MTMHDPMPSPTPAPEEDGGEVVANLNTIGLVCALMIILIFGYRINTNRLKNLPESGVAMILGFILCAIVRTMNLVEEEEIIMFRGNFFFYVLLPPIIFEAGLALDTHMFVDNIGGILAFAIVGTLFSTWLVSQCLFNMAHYGLIGLDVSSPHLRIHCHMFGALISATDPVATIALFGSPRFKADKVLHSLVNGESILNDAVAIALFSVLEKHFDDPDPQLFSASVMSSFTMISVFSLILGLVAGAFTSWCFRRATYFNRFPDTEISAMCLSCYLTFALAQVLGLSGIVAIFFYGAMLSQYNFYNLSEASKVASHVTFTVIAKQAESIVFLYLGVVAAFSIGRFHWNGTLIGFTTVVIVVARAMHVFPLSAFLNMFRSPSEKLSRNLVTVMWISGLRGAIAFALSMELPSRPGTVDNKNTDLLLTTTIAIVAFTTLILGSGMEKIMTFFGVLEIADLDAPQDDHGHASGPSAASLDADAAAISWEASPQWDGSAPVGRRHPSVGGRKEPVWDLRWNARGTIIQAFARFDLQVLQPLLGGPSNDKAKDGSQHQSLELPNLSAFIGQEEKPPTWAREVFG